MPSPADLPMFPIFLAAPPGLEPLLRDEAAERGFRAPAVVPGGVETSGGWEDVWRANLTLRGAVRVLARVGSMRVSHLAQLDKRARALPWAQFLRPDQPVRVEASSRKSRLYHTGAIAQRVETAIHEELGAPIVKGAAEDDAAIRVFVRIDQDVCTVSVDASGAPLHKRGFKQAVGKAPLRESMAALFLRACGYRGDEPVLDPMCGSGTIPIEAAEIALGLAPGRGRAFAFERLASFDRGSWTALRAAGLGAAPPEAAGQAARFFGSDRDAGAVEAARANADRAGVGAQVVFRQQAVSALERPDGPPGLVFVNPPYGARIGEADGLRALYGAFGAAMKARFSGWRVALVTSETSLAKATGLPFAPPGPPVPHGPLRIRLFQTEALR